MPGISITDPEPLEREGLCLCQSVVADKIESHHHRGKIPVIAVSMRDQLESQKASIVAELIHLHRGRIWERKRIVIPLFIEFGMVVIDLGDPMRIVLIP